MIHITSSTTSSILRSVGRLFNMSIKKTDLLHDEFIFSLNITDNLMTLFVYIGIGGNMYSCGTIKIVDVDSPEPSNSIGGKTLLDIIGQPMKINGRYFKLSNCEVPQLAASNRGKVLAKKNNMIFVDDVHNVSARNSIICKLTRH